MGRPWQHRILGHTACCCCRCCSRRAARPAGRTPPSCNYDRSYSSGRWQQFSPPPGHSVAGIIHASRPTQARMSISSVWSCPSDRRRQATPACTQVSRRKTEPSLCGLCSEEACQTTLPWCAGPYPIWSPSLAVQISSTSHLAPLASSCSYKFTTVHSAPSQAAVNHRLLPGHT